MIHLHLLCFLTVIFPALGLPTTPDVVADPRPGRDASDLRVRSPSDATTSTKPMTIIRRNEGQDDKLRQFRRVDPYEEYDLRTRQRSLKGHKARLAKERGEEVSIADEREKVVKESVKKMDLSWREVLDEGRVHELSNKQHATYSDCMGSFSKVGFGFMSFLATNRKARLSLSNVLTWTWVRCSRKEAVPRFIRPVSNWLRDLFARRIRYPEKSRTKRRFVQIYVLKLWYVFDFGFHPLFSHFHHSTSIQS